MDRRALKTKKAIREAFLNLLKKKNLNKITVAEVSQLADLGRGTFYLHYKDIFDLYDHVENDLFSEIEQLIDTSCSNCSPESLLNFSHTITEYIMNNHSTFLILTKPENGGSSLYRLKDCFYKKMIWDNSNLCPSGGHAVEYMFAVSGVIGVLEEWLFNRINLPQKQIAELLSNVLQRLNFEN